MVPSYQRSKAGFQLTARGLKMMDWKAAGVELFLRGFWPLISSDSESKVSGSLCDRGIFSHQLTTLAASLRVWVIFRV